MKRSLTKMSNRRTWKLFFSPKLVYSCSYVSESCTFSCPYSGKNSLNYCAKSKLKFIRRAINSTMTKGLADLLDASVAIKKLKQLRLLIWSEMFPTNKCISELIRNLIRKISIIKHPYHVPSATDRKKEN